MEFANSDEVCHFYEQYSRAKGFAMRQGKKMKNRKGEIVRYTYLCNREGLRHRKWLQMQDRKREHKVVTRCGCQAEMRIKRKANSTSWYVCHFVDEHNHDLLPAKFVSYLPAYRKISDVDVAHIESLRQVGISIPKIYESIAAQAGGFNLVSFTKRDMYNVVRRQRAMHCGDVNAALRYFNSCARADENIYWRYQVGNEQQMCDLFWSDGCSQHDYKIFGDVLAFDATYGRNKYNLPVIVFSGVNHHNQTCVFDVAMVSSETQAAYVWVLGRFLECMGGKAPKVVITDGDRAMRLAIQEVFPEAHHRLCAWHLLKNATVNVCKPRFTTLLRNCMLADVEVEEFERQWDAMMDECGVWEVEWVKDLYAKKMSWATAYIRGCFYAGLRTTSRCESLLHAKMGRNNEEELDFRSLYGSPVLQTQFPELKKSGALNYTKEIFVRFRDALKRSVRITIVECNKLEDRTLDIGCLPKTIVLKRWSKTAKVELEGSSLMNEEGDANAVYKVRVGAFLQHCKRLARVACMRENDFKSSLEKIVEETVFLEMKNGVGTAGRCSVDGAEEGVRDPVTVRSKGTGRGQEPFGCRGRKRRKCSTCGVVGHRRTRCPSGPPSQPTCSQDPTEDIVPHSESQSHAPVAGDEDQSQRGSKTVRVIASPLTDN
ncbi:hypothetical protein AHAS_Ahas04G0129100 [Arachis hypogaea]